MKLYSENENYKLYQGNMLDMLEVIEHESIDSIVTDPPYELNFMSKGWDNAGVSFQKETWQKCYEVLKPGGYLLAFGGSRTFHRIACAIEDAGFEIRDTIMWLYGSGFPKSMDISKQIDKKGGNDYSKQFAKDLKQARESRNLTMKYCDDKYCNGSTNWSWYEGRKDGCRVPDYKTYLEIIKEFPELEKYRELIKEAEREVIGSTITNKTVYQKIGDKNISGEINITIPETDLAKQWQGWGTALKPSFEPIIVARKPFKGSLVDNVIENGVGGLNIDECRVGNEIIKGGTMPDFRDIGQKSKEAIGIDKLSFGQVENAKRKPLEEHTGRFPANTILTYDETDFDEVCGGFPNTSGKDGNKIKSNDFRNYGESFGNNKKYYHFNDSGSASRYFYCAKASKRDRDEGLEKFEEKQPACVTDFRPTLATHPENWNNGNPVDNPMMRTTPRKNVHPTVKPTSLMQYLVRLVTPNGGTILDPFNGSGSTGKAVMYENHDRNKNYKYIGIELTEEYLPIAQARIEYVCNLKEEKQTTIDDFID